jgi:hypothetical protein
MSHQKEKKITLSADAAQCSGNARAKRMHYRAGQLPCATSRVLRVVCCDSYTVIPRVCGRPAGRLSLTCGHLSPRVRGRVLRAFTIAVRCV